MGVEVVVLKFAPNTVFVGALNARVGKAATSKAAGCMQVIVCSVDESATSDKGELHTVSSLLIA